MSIISVDAGKGLVKLHEKRDHLFITLEIAIDLSSVSSPIGDVVEKIVARKLDIELLCAIADSMKIGFPTKILDITREDASTIDVFKRTPVPNDVVDNIVSVISAADLAMAPSPSGTAN